MHLSGVRQCVCLSVRPSLLSCGPRGQAISIDCCTARLQQAQPPFDLYLQHIYFIYSFILRYHISWMILYGSTK